MIYRKDKKILKIIRKELPNLPNYFYDVNYIWKIAYNNKKLKISSEEFISCLTSLSNDEYISFDEKSHGTAFRLCNSGRYYYEYRYKMFLNYIMQKWVDVLALVISIIALVVSVA